MMIYGRFLRGLTAQTITLLLVVALLLSAIPASIFVAAAALSSSIEFVSTQKSSYAVGEEVVLKVVRGSAFAAGGVDVELTSARGGEFSGANITNVSCSAFQGGSGFADIASNANQKGFCYRSAHSCEDTITATFSQGTTTETVQLKIVVAELAPVEVNPNVSICHATQADKNPYNTFTVDAKAIVNLPNGHNDHHDGGLDDVGDIIPPFEYDFDGTGLKQYLGKNWTTVYSNGLTGAEIHGKGECAGRPVEVEADVAVSKSVGTAAPVAGTNVTYTITVINNGPEEATGIIVTDPLAGDLSYVSSTAPVSATDPLKWHIGTLDSGESWSTQVTVVVDASAVGASVTNTATVISSTFDPVLDNNSSTATIRPVESQTTDVLGCTDADATNYDSKATVDDGTCLFPLAIKKQFSDGTQGTTSDFSFTINGVSTTTFTASGTNLMAVASGTYTIREVAAIGYRASYSGCDGVVIAGTGATCTITNTAIVDPEPDTYRIEGFVWHDDNRNTVWDSEETEEEFILTELPLAGWVVNITNGSSTYSTTTDENGYYYFEVVAGTWIITEVVQEGWEQTTVESYTVTVPELYEASALETIFAFLLPIAHAAVVGAYGDYDFGNDTSDDVTPTPERRSGGSGTRVKPKILTAPAPTPLILGEQVSVVPAGAPGAGQGGAASAGSFTLGQLLYPGARGRREF